MLPDSRHLFAQGGLDSELDGRRKRLRQMAKDLDAGDLAGGDEPAVDRLVERFDLREVTIGAGEAGLVTSDGGPRLRIPFTGSAVLLHRSSGAGDPFPGRVVERSQVTGGERVRRSWVEVPVPDGQGGDAQWQAAVLAGLAGRVAEANGRLPGFRQALRECAAEAVGQRRARLGAAPGGTITRRTP